MRTDSDANPGKRKAGRKIELGIQVEGLANKRAIEDFEVVSTAWKYKTRLKSAAGAPGGVVV